MGPSFPSFLLSLSHGLRFTAEELEAARVARLRQLLDHAYSHVPYYRRLFDSVGFRPGHLKGVADLRHVPITTRAELRKVAPQEITSQGLSPGQLQASRTSGSTGVPLTVFRTNSESWQRRLLTWRTFWTNGIRWDDRVVMINSRPTSAASAWRKPFPYLNRQNLYFREDPNKLLASLCDFRPSVIYGYTAIVAILADLSIKKGIDSLSPRLIATSSAVLSPGFRRVIEKAFHTDPIDIYNCTELGDIAWQCRRRSGYHINADWLVVELLRDGERVQAGEIGEVVATSLYRYAMPLIRYSPGDAATLAETPCSCAVGLPVLASVEGRTNHIAPLPDGRFFFGFFTLMSHFPEVERFQIVQTALDSFSARIVVDPRSPADLPERIARALSEGLGPEVRVECRVVDAIEPLPSGKYQPIVPLTPVDFGNA